LAALDVLAMARALSVFFGVAGLISFFILGPFGNEDKLTPILQEPAGIVLLIKLLLVAALIVILFMQVYTYGAVLVAEIAVFYVAVFAVFYFTANSPHQRHVKF